MYSLFRTRFESSDTAASSNASVNVNSSGSYLHIVNKIQHIYTFKTLLYSTKISISNILFEVLRESQLSKNFIKLIAF